MPDDSSNINVSIKQYVDALFAERRAQDLERERALASANQEAGETRRAVERHQNEFRGALADAQDRFLSREVYEERHRDLERRVDIGERDRTVIREQVAGIRGRAVVATAVIAVCSSAVTGFIVHLVG